MRFAKLFCCDEPAEQADLDTRRGVALVKTLRKTVVSYKSTGAGLRKPR